MRQHKLALCADHFAEWIVEQTGRFIRKYHMFTHDERVLVAVSGGKDSLSLWDVLDRLGYRVDGLYIGLGIDEGIAYSDNSLAKIEAFLEARPHLSLTVVDVKSTYGATIPEAAALTHRGRKPCAVCGLIKRYIMNRVALEGDYDAIATGHNLDDEVAVLFGNVLNWQTGYLARQGPVLPESELGLVRKVKPFCRLYEREIAAYALIRGIDYIYDECPFSEGATTLYYKTILNKLEEDRPGTKLRFYLEFLRAREEGAFSGLAEEVVLHKCTSCGQPTGAKGECAFCRLWARVRERTGQAAG